MRTLNEPGAASSNDRAAATRLLDLMETKLVAHGFRVEVERVDWSLVVGTDVRDLAMPGETIPREQALQLALDDQGDLRWFLLWPAGGSTGRASLASWASQLDEVIETLARLLVLDEPAPCPT